MKTMIAAAVLLAVLGTGAAQALTSPSIPTRPIATASAFGSTNTRSAAG